MTETPKEARARLLQEQIAATRAATLRRQQASPYLSPETVASRQAAELAALPRAVPIPVIPSAVDALPTQARAAAGLPVVNPKLWRVDLKPIHGRVDKDGWLKAVRALPKQPDLSLATVIDIAASISWFVGREIAGWAWVSYEAIATAVRRCPETVRKVIRVLEAQGLLDTFNVLVRRDGQVLRDRNAYGLRGFIGAVAAIASAVVDAVTGAFDRMGEQLRRYAPVLGLKPRKWGLNATPSPSIRTAPEPA